MLLFVLFFFFFLLKTSKNLCLEDSVSVILYLDFYQRFYQLTSFPKLRGYLPFSRIMCSVFVIVSCRYLGDTQFLGTKRDGIEQERNEKVRKEFYLRDRCLPSSTSALDAWRIFYRYRCFSTYLLASLAPVHQETRHH